jgi:GNAT superfamily N-acetyltransferase
MGGLGADGEERVEQKRLTIKGFDGGSGDEAAVIRLMTEYLEWALAEMEKEHVIFPGSFDSESVKRSLVRFQPPGGRLLIAELDGVPIGIGALRSLDDKVAEIKRMYVRPESRGLHAGSRMLDDLIEEARKRGAESIRLDSAWFMVEARNLYLSRGFAERPPYEGTEIPVNLQPRWKFFEKRL